MLPISALPSVPADGRLSVRAWAHQKPSKAWKHSSTAFQGVKLWRDHTASSLLHWALVLLIFSSHLTGLAEGARWKDRVQSSESEENYYDTDHELADSEDEDDHADFALHPGVTDHSGGDKESVEIEIEEHDEDEEDHHQQQPESTGNVVEYGDSSEEDPTGTAELYAQHLSGLTKSKRAKELLPPVTISVPYPVHIERKVPVFIEKKVPVYVEKKVEVPVDRPYEVPVPVYEKEVVHVPRAVLYSVDRPYPVYVHRTVFVNNYQPFRVLIKSRNRY